MKERDLEAGREMTGTGGESKQENGGLKHKRMNKFTTRENSKTETLQTWALGGGGGG